MKKSCRRFNLHFKKGIDLLNLIVQNYICSNNKFHKIGKIIKAFCFHQESIKKAKNN